MLENLGITNFTVFLIAGILLNLTPGSDTLYILARSVSQGRKAGVLSALGISTGAIVHTIAAACGLSVILANSATAFLLVKYAGALYLIYLGIKAIVESNGIEVKDGNIKSKVSGRQIYVAGVFTNVLNPKVALFFLAFLPQFIVEGANSSFVSFLVLGGTFVTTGTIWCLILAFFGSAITAKLTGGNSFSALLHRVSGTLFIGLGIRLAFSER